MYYFPIYSQFISLNHQLMMPLLLFISKLLWVGCSSRFGSDFFTCLIQHCRNRRWVVFLLQLIHFLATFLSVPFFLHHFRNYVIILFWTADASQYLPIPSTAWGSVTGNEVSLANFILTIALNLLKIGALFLPLNTCFHCAVSASFSFWWLCLGNEPTKFLAQHSQC